MKLIISQALICDANSQYNGKTCDILIENGRIEAIATSQSGKIKPQKGMKEIPCKGKVLAPAFMDLRADFCDPGNEHRETLQTGAAAAIASGYSDVAVLPSTQPARDNKSAIEYVLNQNHHLPVTLHPLGCATKSREGKEMAELFDMKTAGAVAFTDGNRPIAHAGLLLRILQYNKIFNGILMVLAEDKELSGGGIMHEGKVNTLLGLKGIPELAEEAALMRDIEILKYTEGRLHVSCVSTKGSVDLIRKAKKAGLKITADVAVAQLCFTDDDLLGYDVNYKVLPPLRTKAHQKALWEALDDGTIDAICSNHQPMSIEDKAVEFDYAAFGMATFPLILPFLLKAKPAQVKLETLIGALSWQPRKVLQLPQVSLSEGSAASLVCLDIKATTLLTHNPSKGVNLPLQKESLPGKVEWVMHKNKVHSNK